MNYEIVEHVIRDGHTRRLVIRCGVGEDAPVETLEWGMDVAEGDALRETLAIVRQKYERPEQGAGLVGEDLASVVTRARR